MCSVKQAHIFFLEYTHIYIEIGLTKSYLHYIPRCTRHASIKHKSPIENHRTSTQWNAWDYIHDPGAIYRTLTWAQWDSSNFYYILCATSSAFCLSTSNIASIGQPENCLIFIFESHMELRMKLIKRVRNLKCKQLLAFRGESVPWTVNIWL